MYVCIDLIIMQDKIKTSPVKIEDFIKSEVPFLSNVIVIGHKRNYLTCLVTLKVSNAMLEAGLIVYCA